MAVAVRIECDAERCTRHFDIDVATAAELADLSASSAGVWLEVLLDLPAGWTADGSMEGFVVLCAAHAPASG